MPGIQLAGGQRIVHAGIHLGNSARIGRVVERHRNGSAPPAVVILLAHSPGRSRLVWDRLRSALNKRPVAVATRMRRPRRAG